MNRIIAIDYGSKKCGIAVSDPLRIIATGLDTVPTNELYDYLSDYFAREPVGTMVVGDPRHKDGTPTNLHGHIVGFVRKIQKLYPALEIAWQDEFYTSQRAKQSMLAAGIPKKKRQEKNRVDKIAATLILQDYMEDNLYR